MTARSAGPDRFHLLDGLRAAAAIAVLFWHYQHFYIPLNGRSAIGSVQDLPLAWLFGWFYRNGHLAVQLFWTISGFVFTHVYQASSATTRGFVLNRLARLYPLHFVTLVLVAVLQAGAMLRFGESQIYGGTTLANFAKQLLFASNWDQARRYSFNGPIWSVSVEIVVYALFWVVRRPLARMGLFVPIGLVACGIALQLWDRDSAIGACMVYFFCGAATHSVFDRLRSRAAFGWAIVIALLGAAYCLPADSATVGKLDPRVAMACIGLVLAFALAERWVARRFRGMLGGIGDTTYGLYLWHVPLQLGLFLILGEGLRDAAGSAWFLVAFIGAVLVMARCGFVALERPASRAIRRRLGGKARNALPRIPAP